MKKLILTVLVLLSATAHAAFDGSGNFNRLYNWQADKAANIKIQASRMDAEMDGMATGLSTCITKDGQTTVTSNISLNSHKLTALSNATASTDAVNASQVRDNTLCSGTGGGSLNAYTFTRNITGSSYVTGTVVWMPAPFTNTAAATLNLDGLGAKTIKKNGTTDLTSGDIVSGTTYPFFYDGTYWQAPTVAQAISTPDSIVSSTSIVKAISATSNISVTAGGQNVMNIQSQTVTVSGSLFVGSTPINYPNFRNMTVYTSSGTFLPPAGVTKVFVEVWGGGASGGGYSSSSGSGGGSGGYSAGFVTVTPSVSVTVTVGTGATSSASDGNASSFAGGSTLTANGGSAGVTGVGSNAAGGAGGSASGGTFNLTGGRGCAGIVSPAISGCGGNAPRGGQGGNPNVFNSSPPSQTSGAVPGGGGGGAASGFTNGGNGGNGMVVVYYP